MLTFQLDLPRASYSEHGLTRTMVTVNHVDNKFTTPTLGHEVANILASLPLQVGNAENFSLEGLWNLQSTESLELEDCLLRKPRQLRGGNLVESQNTANELR